MYNQYLSFSQILKKLRGLNMHFLGRVYSVAWLLTKEPKKKTFCSATDPTRKLNRFCSKAEI